jgi:hypothetical protein
MCTAQPVDATGRAALMSTGLSDVVHVDEIRRNPADSGAAFVHMDEIRFRRDELEA